MNIFLEKSMEINKEIIENRRFCHQNAGIGFEIDTVVKYAFDKLKSYGYNPIRLGRNGLTCSVGNETEGPVILLRADMDALPMEERSGLPFASLNKGIAHCCGHDLHTAMLLGTAKILKEYESSLKGVVKFMFQPAEEIGEGAKNMVINGLLENPKPDAVLALHVNAKAPLKHLNYGSGTMFASNNNFKIYIKGQSSHAARPHEGKDPIMVGMKIYQAIDSFKSHELNSLETVILSITGFESGTAFNVLPDEATIKGTLRTYDERNRINTIKRLKQLTQGIGELYGVKINFEINEGISTLYCSPKYTQELLGYAGEILNNIAEEPVVKMGSEDFSEVTRFYPETSAYLSIGAGIDENTPYPVGQHNPEVIFNEEILPYGTALTATCAVRWLENQVN